MLRTYESPSSSRIVSRFKREPSRTGSLIITFYGDAISRAADQSGLALLQFLDMLGTDGGVVRTAVSRLAADGWLDRDKAGRKSFYKLAKRGRAVRGCRRARLQPASVGLGGALRASPDRQWCGSRRLPGGADRGRFGSPVPGVWVAPSNVPTPPGKGAIRLEVSADDATGRRLVEASWSLERTADPIANS
jgi:phenylacetic acid degradation operon negative regulatory protein